MPTRPLTLVLAAFLAASLSFAAHAATVNVVVNDAAGRPIPDAVVMLEPVTGTLPTRPLGTVEIAQIRRQFTPAVTVVTVGTPVTFPNQDTVRHHVYSFSPAKNFELKLYAGSPHAPVVFDKPGIAVLGCNIHDQMTAWVVVVDTPLHTRSSTAGRASIGSVPAGAYRLRAWHPGMPGQAEPTSTPISVAQADVEQRVQLNLAATPK
ncbi:methylamine utilization protein [Piscinibacter koreensis]|uniref:Methylamine utilization protein n=1 Tax=Piscinibacter koreensis TaxID=2742824 RepID=A0A7Y6TVT2_9BURK|nr:methylamine utilization protein [Schlegelella koreensis]NUZ05267.1 methylamine utilization protein [Schlegelella koreensis]